MRFGNYDTPPEWKMIQEYALYEMNAKGHIRKRDTKQPIMVRKHNGRLSAVLTTLDEMRKDVDVVELHERYFPSHSAELQESTGTEPQTRKRTGGKVTKPVVCLTTGERFDSVRHAADFLKVNSSRIYEQLNGKIAHVSGMKFMYRDEFDSRPTSNLEPPVKFMTAKKDGVVHLGTGVKYASAEVAAKAFNISPSSVRKSARKKVVLQCGEEFRWGEDVQ